VVENVEHMRYWQRFDEWHGKLVQLGYKTKVAVIDSQDHGTPQSRKRLFVICDRDVEPELPPALPGRKRTVRSILGRGESKESPWGFRPVDSPERATATLDRAERAIKKLGADRPFIMVYYGTDGAGGFQTLNRPLRTVTTLDRFAYVRPNGNGHEMRMLQPSELAAAMGFPEYHVFPQASRRNKIRLAGNAVCPPVMRDVITQLIRSWNTHTHAGLHDSARILSRLRGAVRSDQHSGERR
jgi:DNA (cytosine-5)-methyltransferase 1